MGKNEVRVLYRQRTFYGVFNDRDELVSVHLGGDFTRVDNPPETLRRALLRKRARSRPKDTR